MARRYFIAGNWKMNNTAAKAKELIGAINAQIASETSVDVAVCPTFTALDAASKALAGSNVKLGAQNMYVKASGAYTGEIAADMLKEFGCEYVILGHSERREYFKETDAFINEKVLAVLANGMKPILCVGEKLEEREAGKTIDIVSKQTEGGLAGVSKEDAGKIGDRHRQDRHARNGAGSPRRDPQNSRQALRGRHRGENPDSLWRLDETRKRRRAFG